MNHERQWTLKSLSFLNSVVEISFIKTYMVGRDKGRKPCTETKPKGLKENTILVLEKTVGAKDARDINSTASKGTTKPSSGIKER